MPVPAMIQAINVPRTPVACPNDAGSAKMPEPIIDPITSAMSALRESFWSTSFDEGAMRRMAFRPEMKWARPRNETGPATLGRDLRSDLPVGTSGIPCRGQCRKSARRRPRGSGTPGGEELCSNADWPVQAPRRRSARSWRGRIRLLLRFLLRYVWRVRPRLPDPRAHIRSRPGRARTCRRYEKSSACGLSRPLCRELPVTSV
ncbi:hypothetical protein ACVWW5_005380 [Bradyrhizobium sp. LM3.4]